MENRTIIDYFEIVAFSNSTKNRPLLFALYLLIYLIGLLGNISIIICVITDMHLHAPMYIFLSNLSVVDMIFTSSTLPKLMDILVTGNNSISFIECFTQMYFYMFAASTEDVLLSFMAYDRYVAICKPLYYHMTMNRRNYTLFLTGTWMLAFLHSLILTMTIYQMKICHSNKIHNICCEIKAFNRIMCGNNKFHLLLITEIIVLGLLLFLLNLTSYMKIISIILRIPSTTGRKKAFSTCSSHLIILGTFYVAAMSIYLKPLSEHLEKQDLVFSTLFSAVTPMLNPIIYSLRNVEVKSAMKKILSFK